MLTRYGRLGASSRMRFIQYFSMLNDNGYELTHLPLINDNMLQEMYDVGAYSKFCLLKAYIKRFYYLTKIKNYDAVWVQSEFFPFLPVFFENLFFSSHVPIFVDYDDAIFHKYDINKSLLIRRFLGHKLDVFMSNCKAVFAGNGYLADRAIKSGAELVELLPTVVDLSRYNVKAYNDSISEIKIVWIGSKMTVKYLEVVFRPLQALAKKYDFSLVVVGAELQIEGVKVSCYPWSEEVEASLIESSDIGIMPLVDSPWERGKCGYKLIQYMACGLPVVASPIGVNKEIVTEDKNGFLCETDNDWISSVGRLMESAELRFSLGKFGRKLVEEKYNTIVAGEKIIQNFCKILK